MSELCQNAPFLMAFGLALGERQIPRFDMCIRSGEVCSEASGVRDIWEDTEERDRSIRPTIQQLLYLGARRRTA